MTPRRSRLLLLLAAATGWLAGCEKVDLGDTSPTAFEEDGGSSLVWPSTSGQGTQDAPLLVEQILHGTDVPTGETWVIGYVVGSTYRTLAQADFSGTAAYTSNVLLASDSLCTNADRCIPVELSSTAMQRALSLPQNPGMHRQCAMVYGTPARYFSRNGLRNVRAAYWLPGFHISDIYTLPAEWDNWEGNY